MSRTLGLAVLLLASMGTASADIPPPPGEREHMLATKIRDAGFACPEPATYDYLDEAAGKKYWDQGLSPARVVCKDGKAFLVAVTSFRHHRAQASADTPPVVRPMK